MRIRSSSSWSRAGIEQFLQETVIPVRLACLAGDGRPLICSLWYAWTEGALWCATQRDARLVRRLQMAPGCAFEVAGDQPPYRGVRGQGQAWIDPAQGAAMLARLIDRYLGGHDSDFARWLLSRSDREVAIRIRPDWVTAWDFSARMGAAVTGRDH